MDKPTVTEYDKRADYKKNIAPIVEELVKACTKAQIPMFVSIAPFNSAEETGYENDGVLTGSLGLTLKEDEFEKYLAVLHGGKVTFPGGDPALSEGKMFEYIASTMKNAPVEDDPEDDENLEEVMKNELK